jgi:hypothetical protein
MGIMKQLESGAGVYRQEIERELAARIQQPKPSEGAKVRPAGRRAASEPVACACGTANDADARFCKQCGAKLTEARA